MRPRKRFWFRSILGAGVTLLLVGFPGCGGTDVHVAGWTRLHLGQSEIDHVVTVPGRPNVVYAITRFGSDSIGTLRSTDGGETWRGLVDPRFSEEYLESYGEDLAGLGLLAIDPRRPTTLYGLLGDLIFKSTDGGASWAQVSRPPVQASGPPGLSFVFISTLVVDRRSPQTLYSSVDNGVYKSTNGGASWSQVSSIPIPTDDDVQTLAIDPRRPSILYAGTIEGLYKSKDGAASWRRTAVEDAVDAIAIDPRKPRTLYVIGDDVFRSTNRGETWKKIPVQAAGVRPCVLSASSGDEAHLSADALAIDSSAPDTIYVAATDRVCSRTFVLKSTDAAESWAVVARLKATVPLAGESDVRQEVTFDNLAVDPTGRRVYASTNVGRLFLCETCWKIKSPPLRRRR